MNSSWLFSSAARQILTAAIAGVWLVNGLFCKVLNGVPRHRLIVATILGAEHAATLTKAIGVAEVMMAAWIVSGMAGGSCAVVQIVLVTTMNLIELVKAPHLLLFGRKNILVAFLFLAVVYYHAFLFPAVVKP